MNKKKFAILSLLLGGLLLIGALFLSNILRSQGAGLLVESDTPSQVYINGDVAGRTPLIADLQAGEVTVKIVPDAVDGPYMPYETKVALEPGIQTVIRRQLGSSPEIASGEVISFKKLSESTASLAVVTIPDGAQINLDGQNKGSSPLTIPNVGAGNHNLEIKAGGYNSRQFSIKAVEGYRLTAIVNLAVSKEVRAESLEVATKPSATKKEIETVEILTTPTGFLRVRQEATTASLEIAQVKPTEVYDVVEKDQSRGWYKIKINDTTVGWVTAEFAKLGSRIE